MSKICYLSDFDSSGSGYLNLSLPILTELARRGHEIKVLGLKNQGEQHYFDFSIYPAQTMTEVMGMLQNLWNSWKFDVFMVALDIPLQENILRSIQNKVFPYVGIMPVEADPVSFRFAAAMMKMDKAFIISQFGTDEAQKVGVTNAEHLVLGLDTTLWRIPEPAERKRLRDALGFDEDTFVIFTNADNQERKNWDACFKAFADFKKRVGNDNVKYAILTRWNNLVGWDLEELAMRYGILGNLVRFDRGLPPNELWSIYAISDAFMILSKSEGACLPIFEAFASGVPVLGTDCTATREHLSDGRGYLVDYEYIHCDPFGCANRYWADPENAAYHLKFLYDMKKLGNYGVGVQQTIQKAREYIEARTWSACADQIERYLVTLDEQTKSQQS